MTETTKRSNEKCCQCGESLSPDRNATRFANQRRLCSDCAFDAIPCTD